MAKTKRQTEAMNVEEIAEIAASLLSSSGEVPSDFRRGSLTESATLPHSLNPQKETESYIAELDKNPERRPRVFIGIPCYGDVSGETLEDYMRFMYHIGRRNTEIDFFLGIKMKSEQFRARNALVEGALQVGADYLFMMDDDQIISWALTTVPTSDYDLIAKLLAHKKDIVGALYYHRGGECLPVVMKEGKDGGYYYMREDEVLNQLQEVAVQGGGCMLLDMNIFSRIPSPWFEPELKLGTDIQICQKAREQGYSVWCDTSIVLGHVKKTREVVTPENRFRIRAEHTAKGGAVSPQGGLDQGALTRNALALYRMDAEEYLRMPFQDFMNKYHQYQAQMARFGEYSKEERDQYYIDQGDAQLARQVMFHHTDPMTVQLDTLLKALTVPHGRPGGKALEGMDFACGSSPVGFELAMRGHLMTFHDLDGAGGFEFTKWRAGKRLKEGDYTIGWSEDARFDYILALDAFEHFEDWEPILDKMKKTLKPNGILVSNIMSNYDYQNTEHVNMDKKKLNSMLVERGIYPLNQYMWVNRDMGFMDDKPAGRA